MPNEFSEQSLVSNGPEFLQGGATTNPGTSYPGHNMPPPPDIIRVSNADGMRFEEQAADKSSPHTFLLSKATTNPTILAIKRPFKILNYEPRRQAATIGLLPNNNNTGANTVVLLSTNKSSMTAISNTQFTRVSCYPTTPGNYFMMYRVGSYGGIQQYIYRGAQALYAMIVASATTGKKGVIAALTVMDEIYAQGTPLS